MAATFSRTLRCLEADHPRHVWPSLLLAVLFAASAAWLVLARVTVYEASASARLEVQAAAHSVAAPITGKVAETHLTLGREVTSRDVLVLLDSEAERRAIEEKLSRCEALRARSKALAREIEEEEKTLTVQRASRLAVLQEGRAEVEEAEARAEYAQQALKRVTTLRGTGASSEEELQKAQTEAKATRAAAEGATLRITRRDQDRLADEGERSTQLAKLNREAVELAGELTTEAAAIHRIEQEIELRAVRAPVTGRVGEVGEFHVGSVVRAAERLATVIPPGQPRAVALFPAAAVGRIVPGQAARVRLDGFPWTQYGLLSATVSGVGNEANAGLVRVELALATDPTSRIPIQHGLTGSVEVAVEQVSPGVLVLRAAGQFLSPNNAAPEAAERREP